MSDRVILVDEKDLAICDVDKLEVDQKRLLHRSFSIFIYNGVGQFLLQRRAKEKFHSVNL